MNYNKNIPSTKSWVYKVMVILLIPCLYVYYAILQPLATYFKSLIAEQDGSIQYREPTSKISPHTAIRKAFIRQSTTVLADKLIIRVHRYMWATVILFVVCLVIIIGIIPAIECIVLWIVIRVFYTVITRFFKGVNQ